MGDSLIPFAARTTPDGAEPAPEIRGAFWQPTGPRVVCQFTRPIVAGPPGQPNGWAVRVNTVWINPSNITLVGGDVRLINFLYGQLSVNRVRYVGWSPPYHAGDGQDVVPFDVTVPFP